MREQSGSSVVSSEAGLSSLPSEKQLQVDKILAAIGSDADEGTAFILAALARRLPEASLVKVSESVRNPKVRNRAGYAVAALQSEFAELANR